MTNFFLCLIFREPLRGSTELVQRLYESILKECKKESLTYRSRAIRVLSLLADEYHFQVYELFWSWLEKTFRPPVKFLSSKVLFCSSLINVDLGGE